MTEKTVHERTNRLIDETSPYLLQHAHNPVDWYPWSEEALRTARDEGKLILLSIGYSACHWCHVMERESFEDEEIARLMNESFVNIKVDREERPDLDEIYMAATVAMNRGQGGWPMTVFLTPGLEPVFAGTYFPPHDAHGRPGFPTVLRQVARAWREDPEGLRRRAAEFAERLRQHRSVGPALAIGESELRSALDAYAEDFDPRHGGFGHAPKFPPAVGIQLLLRLARRFDDGHARDMAVKTLAGMARGGMYDHIGGGFCRYSTDARWLVPHFEKMLYDNALLVKAYLEGWLASGDEEFRRVAIEVLDYARREMTSPEGGFFSSTDADSDGIEGQFFVWTPEQVADVLDEEAARWFNAYYDITPTGNWEGKSIPNTPRRLDEVASELGIEPTELRESLEASRRELYEAREKRVKPGLDDKILTAWNGLMIGAMAEGHRVLRDPRYLESAERAAEFVLSTLARDDGRLLRTYREGKAHLNAYLEDYAYLAQGLLDLYEASGRLRWLREAERLLERVLADFLDEETGAFYSTAVDHERLLMRYQDGADGATPAPNAVAAATLARLGRHLDRQDLGHAAIRAIRAHGSMISRYPRGFAKSLCVADFVLAGPIELAFVGRSGSDDLEALLAEAGRHFLPNRIIGVLDPDRPDQAEALPLLAGKGLVDGRAALYVCRDFACQAPVTDPAGVRERLAAAVGGGDGATTIAVRLPGRATADATRAYADRFPKAGYRPFGSSGLTTAKLGFGAYRVHNRSNEHRTALAAALAAGINLIDTSTNYLDGGSERMIGSVVREQVDAGRMRREELIVVSKIGYLQGANLELAREREQKGEPFPEVVKYEEGLWHCIHPEFLAEQLRRSLDRLELETLDFCLLHNPEYSLMDAARRGVDLDEARDDFYGSLQASFEFLEEQVAEGRLAGYGVSSNTAGAPADDPGATSLARMLDAARRAGGDEHAFGVLQLPLNLLESGALTHRNDGPAGDLTVLEAAAEAGIAVLANRPLNAFSGDRLVRLADVPMEEPGVDFETQLGRVADLEMTFRAEIAPRLKAARDSLDPGDYFRMAERLKEMRRAVTGWAHWSQLEAQINYTIAAIVTALDDQLEGEIGERWSEWRDGYLPELQELLRETRQHAAELTRARSEKITSAIDPLLPEDRRGESLSRKALWVVASTPGVAAALNGMRTAAYVQDSTGILAWPDLEDVAAIYDAARS